LRREKKESLMQCWEVGGRYSTASVAIRVRTGAVTGEDAKSMDEVVS